MASSKRRTAQQIAADAQAAYRATVAKQHAAAVAASDRLAARAAWHRDKAHVFDKDAEAAETDADRYAAEMARIDCALAALTEGTQP